MNFHYLLPSLLIMLMTISCQPNPQPAIPKVDINQVLEDYQKGLYDLYPLNATNEGKSEYNDQLPNDLTDEFQAKLVEFYASYRDKVSNINTDSLSLSEAMSLEILKWEIDITEEGLKFPTYYMPINQFWSLPLNIGQYASGSSAQPFNTPKDYDNWLSRLDKFTEWCDSALARMKEGVSKGYTLPKSLVTKIIPQFENLANTPLEDHLFYLPIKNIPADFSEEEKSRLTAAYQSMINDKLVPKFKELTTYFANDYMQAGRESSGISAIPDGDKYYQYLIKYYTTTDMKADEIHQLGLSEVARIRGEMEKVKETVGFKGDLNAFFNHVRTSKKLMPFTNADQVIANFEHIHEVMTPQLHELFDLVPKTPFEIRRTEAFREASASAEYNQGSEDGTRPGIFYVPVPDAKKYNIYSDESLFLHEAIPGHHYQISLQGENSELPGFRKFIWYGAYGEGWALYCESLGKELGLYTDPYQYFGMLSAEIHRAIRLVVDTGIHTQGWSREKAIAYSLENEAESEASVTAEIERYMAIPGQALSYKIGQLKIKELRDRASEKLGSKFDIKKFHNKILEDGCLPLNILERKIDGWIAEELS